MKTNLNAGFALLLMLATSIGCRAADDGELKYTSLVALLSNPKAFDKARIITVGYLQNGHRGSFLFLHEEDARNGLAENGIPLDYNPKDQALSNQMEKDDKHYVRIRGRFIAYAVKNRISMGYIIIEKIILPNEYFDDMTVKP